MEESADPSPRSQTRSATAERLAEQAALQEQPHAQIGRLTARVNWSLRNLVSTTCRAVFLAMIEADDNLPLSIPPRSMPLPGGIAHKRDEYPGGEGDAERCAL